MTNDGHIELHSNNGFAISGTGNANRITNAGRIETHGTLAVAISAVDGVSAGEEIVNTGRIETFGDGSIGITPSLGESGYRPGFASFVENRGIVHTHGGGAAGVFLGGENHHLVNSGEIVANGGAYFYAPAGLFFNAAGVLVFGSALIENTRSGIIKSESEASAAVDMRFGGPVRLENAGLIGGSLTAILGGSGQQTVVNHGHIVGNVDLGSGDDTFVLGSGGSVLGKIVLGDGHDRAIIENGSGISRIADFVPGHTSPDFADVSVFYSSFRDLLAHTTQVGSDAFIRLDRDDTLVLENVNRDDLEQNNFVFAGDLNGLPAANSWRRLLTIWSRITSATRCGAPCAG